MLHLFGAHFVGNHLQQMLWCVQMNVPMFDLIFLLKLIHVRLYLRSTAKAIDICFKEINAHTFFDIPSNAVPVMAPTAQIFKLYL
jgi:hypothetical protein